MVSKQNQKKLIKINKTSQKERECPRLGYDWNPINAFPRSNRWVLSFDIALEMENEGNKG